MTGPAHDATVGDDLAMSPGQRRAYRSLRRVLTVGAKGWFRLTVTGTEHVPPHGAFILTPGGHRSIIDTPLVALAAPDRILRFMGAESYFEIGGLGPFLRSMGGFPIERGANDRAAMRRAESMLQRGEPLVVFPEGTRRQGPIVDELKPGAAYLACRNRVPLVPVGIGGAERALPIGGRMVRPTKVAMVVGAPIIPPSRDEAGPVKRAAVTELSDQLRERIQELFDEARILARS